jgi:hypothetical protein
VSSPVLFLTGTQDGRLGLVAALEQRQAGALGREGARARLQLVPDLAHLSAEDVRGRRIDLGALLRASETTCDGQEALPAELCDWAAHLIELPEIGTPGAAGDQRHGLRLRLLSDSVPPFQPLWPAPGGGWFELDIAPLDLRAAGYEHAALWIGPDTPGGPSLAMAVRNDARTAALVALLREAGVGGVDAGARSFLADWLERPEATGGPGLAGADRATWLAALRDCLRRALGGSGDERVVVEGGAAVARMRRAENGWEWEFEVVRGERIATLRHPCARATGEALAQLLTLHPNPLAPHWLCLFRGGEGKEAVLERVVDARRLILDEPATWRFAGTAPRPLEREPLEPAMDDPGAPA